MQQIFEDHPDPACVISPDLRIILANAAFARRFNQPPDVLRGMDYCNLVSDPLRGHILAALGALTPDEPTCVLQLEKPPEAGSVWITEFHGRAIFNDHGGLIEYQTFGRELTE
ncbi:MAG: PAS domain-containing protein [Geminicoccaceae bacterium]